MGTRRTSEFGSLARKTQKTVNELERLKQHLDENASARIAVNTAIGAVSAIYPPVGTVVGVYKISKTVYEVAEGSRREYEKTRNPRKAVEAGVRKATGVGLEASRKQTISSAVDASWRVTKEASNINTTAVQDSVLKSAAKNTLNEVLPKWKKESKK